MGFLGIDQSLNGTGLCLLDSDGNVEHWETVAVGARRGPERLMFIETRTENLLKRKIQFVCLEGYSYDSTGKVFQLGEVGGVLQLLVYKHGVEFVVVPPASLKKYAVGDARASKEALIAAARGETRVEPADDNQADAYWLAHVARALNQPLSTALPRHQLEVLHQLQHTEPKKKRRVRRLVKNAI